MIRNLLIETKMMGRRVAVVVLSYCRIRLVNGFEYYEFRREAVSERAHMSVVEMSCSRYSFQKSHVLALSVYEGWNNLRQSPFEVA